MVVKNGVNTRAHDASGMPGPRSSTSIAGKNSGSAEEEIAVDYDSDPLEIGFNSRYLLDIAQQIEGQGARFHLSDAASPTVVRDTDDASALYVLMPMRV